LEIEEGLKQADSGEVIPHEEVLLLNITNGVPNSV
jgi:predicted transcriptional regulator